MDVHLTGSQPLIVVVLTCILMKPFGWNLKQTNEVSKYTGKDNKKLGLECWLDVDYAEGSI